MTGALRLPRRWLLAVVAGAAVLVAIFAASAAGTPIKHHGGPKPSGPKPTIVLVHGAWADASGWNGVARRLQEKGYTVVAPANPLRSLAGDAAYLAGVLAQTPGPIVLVGHSYGGAVITNAAAGNPNVEALVYVDAFIPDVGEDILHLAGAESLVPTSIEPRGYPPFGPEDVELLIKPELFRSVFAGDLPERKTALMAAGQRPIALAAGTGQTTATAWKTIPSWAVIGLDDRTITPDAQRSMAQRAGARILEIHASHVSMISRPDAVTRVIQEAVRATD
jgi:pimeloyl-ACP methyl ester carboxylesterase